MIANAIFTLSDSILNSNVSSSSVYLLEWMYAWRLYTFTADRGSV